MKFLTLEQKQSIIDHYVDISRVGNSSKEFITTIVDAVISRVELEIYKNNR